MGIPHHYDVCPLLARIQPLGWLGAMGMILIGLPIWACQAIALARSALFSGKDGDDDSAARAADRGELSLTHTLGVIEHQMLNLGSGIRIHVVSPGRRPGKQLMLLVHGFPECWYSWRHQMAAFREDYDVVAMDMRGYNLSSKPPGTSGYQLDHLMADIPDVVQALGHTSCVLVAHDWGGIISWLVAAAYPKVVTQLVVLAAPHLGLSQVPYLPERMLLADDCHKLRLTFRDGSHGVVHKELITDVDLEWYKQSFQQPGAAKATIDYYRALTRHLTCFPLASVWSAMRRRVQVPVLLFWANRDRALGSDLIKNIEQVAPDIDIVRLDCSHWIQQDMPEEVNQHMRKFLTKRVPSS